MPLKRNGRYLLTGVDARSAYMRCYRDLKLAYERRFAPIDEAKSGIIEAAVETRIQLKLLGAEIANNGGKVSTFKMVRHQQMAGHLRRLLESAVLREEARPRDVTPTVDEYARIVRNRRSRSTGQNCPVDRDATSEAAE